MKILPMTSLSFLQDPRYIMMLTVFHWIGHKFKLFDFCQLNQQSWRTWEQVNHFCSCGPSYLLIFPYACLVAQSCLTLCNFKPTRLLSPWDSPSKNTGVGCDSLLQRIFLTQGLNLHWWWILYCLSQQGSPQYFHTDFKLLNLKVQLIV